MSAKPTEMRKELEKTKDALAELREWRTLVAHHREHEWRAQIQQLEAHRKNGDGAHGWEPPKKRKEVKR